MLALEPCDTIQLMQLKLNHCIATRIDICTVYDWSVNKSLKIHLTLLAPSFCKLLNDMDNFDDLEHSLSSRIMLSIFLNTISSDSFAMGKLHKDIATLMVERADDEDIGDLDIIKVGYIDTS